MAENKNENNNSINDEAKDAEKLLNALSQIVSLRKTEAEISWTENSLYKVKLAGLEHYKKRLEEISGDTKSIVNEIAAINAELSNEKGFSGFLKKFARGVDFTKNQLDNVSNLVSTARRETESFAKSWIEASDASSKFAKNIGLSSKGMDALLKKSLDNVVNKQIGINYNISTPELLEAQQGIISDIGRNIRIYDDAQESIAAMHRLMGGNEKEILVGFENFGLGIEDTEKRIGKMFQTATKSGLSFDKLANNVKQNIAIAQNYTFKNGLAGLESMAKKSAAIKMDMQMIAGLADKVSNVQGSLETAAKLQVLGGSFATFADPMGMLYEGLNDIEGLMDRMTKMIGGLGTFDRQTGEVRVSAFNKQRIRAAAEATGMDYSKLMESINTQTKRKEIDKILKSSGAFNNLTEDERELLRNTATFQNGVAGVSINGQFKKLSDVKSKEDFEILAKETQDIGADVKDIAKSLRGATDILEGRKKQQDAVRAKGLGGTLGGWLVSLEDTIGKNNGLLRVLNGVLLAQMGMSIWGGMKRFGLGTGIGSRGFGFLGKIFKRGGGGPDGNGFDADTAQYISNLTKASRLRNISKVHPDIARNLARRSPLGITERLLRAGTKHPRLAGKIATKGIKTAAKAVGRKFAGGALAKVGAGLLSAGPVGWIAGAAAAAIGGTIAAVKVAQKKRDKAVTNELERKGITKTGKYSARKLKIIEEALHTGQLTNATRRRLAEQGDFAILDEIDRVAKERGVQGTTRQKHGIFGSNINDAKFTITNAYFDGKILNPNKTGVKITGAPAETGYSPIIDELKRVREITEQIANGGVNEKNLNLSPKVELNIGGSIRLTTDKGVTAEIGKALLSDKNFQNALIQLVQKEIAGKPSTTNKKTYYS